MNEGWNILLKGMRCGAELCSPLVYGAASRIIKPIATKMRAYKLQWVNDWVHKVFVIFTIMIGIPEFLAKYVAAGNREDGGDLPAQINSTDGGAANIHLARLLSFCSMALYNHEAVAREDINSKLLANNQPAAEVHLLNEDKDTEILLVLLRDILVIAFRGTEGSFGGDWWSDFQFHGRETATIPGGQRDGEIVHAGLADKVWGSGKADFVVRTYLATLHPSQNLTVYFCGHSLGGAIATLCAAGI